MRRIARRRAGGLTLFGSLLALSLLGVLAAGLAGVIERNLAEARERRAAAGIALLMRAAHDHVTDRFADVLAGPATGEITLAALEAAGHLAPDTPPADAMGRGRRILFDRPAAGIVDLVVTQSVAAGDAAWPWRAAASGAGGAWRLGTVAPGGRRLEGPAVDVDVSGFQGAFAGDPRPRALAAFARIDRRTVFGDQLWRIEVAGFPEINRMEADLDMAGHAITNAGTVEARALAVEDSLTIGGDLEVVGALVVGEAVEVAGRGRFAGSLNVEAAVVTGVVETATLEASGALRAGSLVASGAVSAGAIGTSGQAAVSGAVTVGTLTATTVAARSMTADSLAATAIDARHVAVDGAIEAERAGISRLTVGSCSGC